MQLFYKVGMRDAKNVQKFWVKMYEQLVKIDCALQFDHDKSVLIITFKSNTPKPETIFTAGAIVGQYIDVVLPLSASPFSFNLLGKS